MPATPGVGSYPLQIDSAPAAATVGATEPVAISWDVSGDAATTGRKYLGAISHSDATGLIGLTVVEVDDD